MDDFDKKYQGERRWFGKVLMMEIYHLYMQETHKDWTIQKTANYFKVSIGLVSENLKIAQYSHTDPKIFNCENRKQALDKLR